MPLDFRYLGLGSEQTDYLEAWELQRRLHREVAAGTRPDTVIVLEHTPVYTAGKRTEPQERPLDGTPVIDVDRGGKITWHGPGQLVGYPIVKLPEPVGVVDYVRRLEEAMIDMFTELGIETGRVAGRSGVWLAADSTRPERKIAAIGVRVAAGTTMHGFAINVDPDLTWFDRIIPCGIADAGVTSIAAELGTAPGLPAVAHVLSPYLERYLSFTPYEKSADLASRQTASTSNVTYGLTVAVG
jgi:lipoyl(octanoyl) transferase